MSSVHEVIYDSCIALALTWMLAVVMMGAYSVNLCLSAALTSWVGSGTSNGTSCSTFMVEAGPSGTACDEELSTVLMHVDCTFIDSAGW